MTTGTQVGYVPLNGGLDLVSPVLNVPDGFMLDAYNYEPDINGGYRRIPGFERFDGRPRNFVGLQVADYGSYATGDTVTGQTSGATGTIIGLWSNWIALCSVSGVFQSGEDLDNGLTVIDVTTAVDSVDVEFKVIRKAIEDHYRSVIQPVPGNQPTEGVWHCQTGTVYAFRPTDDLIHIYKATEAGWSEVQLHLVMRYHSGGYHFPEADSTVRVKRKTDTGVELVSAKILKPVWIDGSAESRDRQGYLILTELEGQFATDDRLIIGTYEAGKVESVGYLHFAGSRVGSTSLIPSVGDKLVSQSGGVGILEETIYGRTEEDNSITLWIILSGVTGTFKFDEKVSSIPKPEEPDTEADPPEEWPKEWTDPKYDEKKAFVQLTEEPVPIIRLKDTGDELPQSGDDIIIGDVETELEQRLTYQQKDSSDRIYLMFDTTLFPDLAVDTVISANKIMGLASSEAKTITIPAGGRFEFCEHNFYARPDQRRLYACNGKGPAFELDPFTDLVAPILMPSDEDLNEPGFIAAHKQHLFIGQQGGTLRQSVVGEPMQFSGILGAAEFGVGDDITGLKSIPNLLCITCKNSSHGLYGNTIADWQLGPISDNAGAYAYSLQSIGTLFMLDQQGITELSRVQSYGNFKAAAVSSLAQPVINEIRDKCIGSVVIPDRNLYRIYCNDGTGVMMVPGEPPRITTFNYGIPITCIAASEDKTGSAAVFFGTDNGFIMQADRGTNLDGEPIESAIRTNYLQFKSASYRKTYRRLEVLINGKADVCLLFSHELDYAAAHSPIPRSRQLCIFGGAGFWDLDNWNEFFWSAGEIQQDGIWLDGTGRNISIMAYQSSAWTEPFTIQGFLVHYIMRRLDRG